MRGHHGYGWCRDPLMLRVALRSLDVHSEDAIMVGDRMDTDIVMGTVFAGRGMSCIQPAGR